MGSGTEPLKNKSLASLRVLGTVGEPINEEAWHWYDDYIGKNRCPIVDTWWQTETAGIMISNLAGISKGKPSYATLPLPGIIPLLVDESNGLDGSLISMVSPLTFASILPICAGRCKLFGDRSAYD